MELCECGLREVAFPKTGECRPCYNARYYREHKIVGERIPLSDKRGSIGYAAAHVKVRRVRGTASDQVCITCGGPAHEWAYQGGSEWEQTGLIPTRRPDGTTRNVMLKWTSDPWAYAPMCRKDHAALDRGTA